MVCDLPRTAAIEGREWELRTDFRDVLTILEAFEDPDLTDVEKAYVCLHNLYVDFDGLPRRAWGEAYAAAMAFIDHGCPRTGPRLMDWAQDAPILFPAVNRVAGFEVRAAEYLHWWTFLGYFMEIREGVFATVMALRQKKIKGVRLGPAEQEYWRSNAQICALQAQRGEGEAREREEREKILGVRRRV